MMAVIFEHLFYSWKLFTLASDRQGIILHRFSFIQPA